MQPVPPAVNWHGEAPGSGRRDCRDLQRAMRAGQTVATESRGRRFRRSRRRLPCARAAPAAAAAALAARAALRRPVRPGGRGRRWHRERRRFGAGRQRRPSRSAAARNPESFRQRPRPAARSRRRRAAVVARRSAAVDVVRGQRARLRQQLQPRPLPAARPAARTAAAAGPRQMAGIRLGRPRRAALVSRSSRCAWTAGGKPCCGAPLSCLSATTSTTMQGLRIGSRASLAEGGMCVYVPARQRAGSRSLRLALSRRSSAACDRARISIRSPPPNCGSIPARRRVAVAVDGEVTVMHLPASLPHPARRAAGARSLTDAARGRTSPTFTSGASTTALLGPLAAAVRETEPRPGAVSGDLTQRARGRANSARRAPSSPPARARRSWCPAITTCRCTTSRALPLARWQRLPPLHRPQTLAPVYAGRRDRGGGRQHRALPYLEGRTHQPPAGRAGC